MSTSDWFQTGMNLLRVDEDPDPETIRRVQETIMKEANRINLFGRHGRRFTLGILIATCATGGALAAAGVRAVLNGPRIESLDETTDLIMFDDENNVPEFAIPVDPSESQELLDTLNSGGILLTVDGSQGAQGFPDGPPRVWTREELESQGIVFGVPTSDDSSQ